ncbi:DUF397 domain-containing protein [Streptomyces brevispora]|uniref:Uncharacterized protein DUF397 n=1 Tax=Streptomyces brevispora TaxID=887462 RepID=A0A561UTR5_9ACTN|nr:DUF397 domain-containing protein [Streptomyces brevispora]TWG02758.1 uncharacterized protein DUF397 [Streptomyces brevispora]
MTTESPRWFKSSYSSNGGACVEIAANLAVSRGVVPVRDSKDLSGPTLSFPVASFVSFVAGVKAGGFGTV